MMKPFMFSLTELSLLLILKPVLAESDIPDSCKGLKFTETLDYQLFQLNTTCYQFVNKEVPYYTAASYCKGQGPGGIMIIVDKPKVQKFMAKTLFSLSWTNEGVWIGASKRNTKRVWMWENKSPVTWADWNGGVPPFIWADLNSCAQARRKSNWRWHAYMCNLGYRYICQFSAVDDEESGTGNVVIIFLSVVGCVVGIALIVIIAKVTYTLCHPLISRRKKPPVVTTVQRPAIQVDQNVYVPAPTRTPSSGRSNGSTEPFLAQVAVERPRQTAGDSGTRSLDLGGGRNTMTGQDDEPPPSYDEVMGSEVNVSMPSAPPSSVPAERQA